MYENEARTAHGLMSGIIDRYGPRLPGSQAGREAADELAAAAKPHADEVHTEDFAVYPNAFLGFIRLMLVLYVASVAALPFAPWISAAALAVGAAVLVFDFFLYRGYTDRFYRRAAGRNVWATLEPTGPVERQLIVSGHHDSARIFNFYVDRPELYGRRLYSGMGAYFAFLIAAVILAIVAPGFAVRAGAAVAFAAAFALAAPLWNFASKEGTPGAGDNLAASVAALELLKGFKARRDAGEGLRSTRVIFASFDAEEAGLRGARAWAKARGDALTAVPTWNYNMDCIYSAKDARFLSRDLNGSVALDDRTARACAELAKEAGVDAPVEPIAFLTGGTDAAELARKGVRATTLIAMTWSNADRSPAYHTPADTPDAVGLDALELAIRVGFGLAARIDEGRLD